MDTVEIKYKNKNYNLKKRKLSEIINLLENTSTKHKKGINPDINTSNIIFKMLVKTWTLDDETFLKYINRL